MSLLGQLDVSLCIVLEEKFIVFCIGLDPSLELRGLDELQVSLSLVIL